MLEQIADFLVVLIEKIGLLGIFFATAIESFFPPIPSEIVLISAGFYAQANGGLGVLCVLCICAALGNFAGTLPFYLISFLGSKRLLPSIVNRYGKFLLISMDQINKVEKLFAKRGTIIVFTSRLIPGIRSLVAFPAGLAKMNFAKYTAFTLAGSFIWNLIISGIGFLAYEKREDFFRILKPFENVVLISIAAIILLYFSAIAIEFVRGGKKAK